jgi:hypothetical protein
MSRKGSTIKSSKRIPVGVYKKYVEAKVSFLVGTHWYPSSLDWEYIEEKWREGYSADKLAEEFAKSIKE